MVRCWSEHIIIDLFTKLFNVLIFHCIGAWEFPFMYISVFVSFLKSVVSSFPSENGHIKKFSKKINYYMLWPTPLQIELNHLRKVYVEINDYPSKTVENIIKKELEKENFDITNEPQVSTTSNSEAKLQLFLPFSGEQKAFSYYLKWKGS